MQAAIAQVHERFGALHGVLHAAGIVGEGALMPIQEVTRAACESQFRAKVQGTLNLAEVLRGQRLDVCGLFSCVAAWLGGLGFAVYAAANRFMGAFAQQHNQTQPTPWLSVDWDAWQFAVARQDLGLGASVAKLAMSPVEGAQAFTRLMGLRSLERIIVSTGDLPARFDRWVAHYTGGAKAKATAAPAGQHARPSLQTAYIAPRNDIEEKLAAIWGQLLGIAQVGVHDSFFELGGHSLLATQLMSKVRNTFAVEFSIRRFFESPTVAELSLSIVEKQLGHVIENQDFAALVSRAQDLSEDELQRLLAE
jgi:acyl carrier protein